MAKNISTLVIMSENATLLSEFFSNWYSNAYCFCNNTHTHTHTHKQKKSPKHRPQKMDWAKLLAPCQNYKKYLLFKHVMLL